MNTFVLTPQTANLPVGDLLAQAASGSVKILDAEGNVLAFVLSPVDRDGLIYAEAKLDLVQHADDVQQALGRRGGISTRLLLENAQLVAEKPLPRM